MRVILAAAIVAALAVPALAQQSEKSPEQVQQILKDRADRAANEAYKKSLRSIPDQGPTDPWGGVRSNDASKPEAPRTAKSKAKGTETRTSATRTQ
jgi:hypothetical protein